MEKLLSALNFIPEYAAAMDSLRLGESVAITGIGQINRSHMIAALTRSLSRPVVVLCQDDIAAKKLQEALTAEKFRCAGLQKQVFAGIAKDYVNQNNVLHFASALEPGQVRELADGIAQVCTGWAAVFSPRDGGFHYCLASRDGDLRQLGKEMTAALGGRGGGKPNFQQGTLTAGEAEIRAFFEKENNHA